jgi:hypothetical protein
MVVSRGKKKLTRACQESSTKNGQCYRNPILHSVWTDTNPFLEREWENRNNDTVQEDVLSIDISQDVLPSQRTDITYSEDGKGTGGDDETS